MKKRYRSPATYFLIAICLVAVILSLQVFNKKPQPREPLTKPVITIINPIRGNELGLEKADLFTSLQAQWKVTDSLPATWLWQYSALENDKLVDFAKTEMKGQEFGIFLEIDRNTAQKSGVQYRGQGPWYFSDGVFLTAYDLEERKKIIDKTFSLFKEKFGYYPKTVGAWWIGGESLTYMQQQYGITAALKAADQYDLDVYSFWGSPWSIPYVASKDNEGIPAGRDNSSQVVILQWAARDPTNGYKSATYSVQDFFLNKYDFSYLDYLFPVFLQKPMDNIVIGLENGWSLETFENGYGKYIQKAKELQSSGKVDILLAKDYAEKFLDQESTYSDHRYFLTKAYKSEDQSFWYNSENYRAGIHKTGNEIYLVDLKDYSQKVKEEFAVLPNSQGYFRTSTPSVVDSMRMPSERIHIATSTDALSLEEKENAVFLFSGNEKIAHFTDTSVEIFSDNTSQVFHFQPKQPAISLFTILIGIFFLSFIITFIKAKNSKIILQLFSLLIPLLFAYPFLSGVIGDQHMLFDRKQLWIFSLFPFFSSIPLSSLFVIVQVLPFLVLLLLYFVWMVRKPKQWQRVVFYVIYSLVVLFYIHVPYFPLDRSTYPFIAGVFLLIGLGLFIISIIHFKKTKSKRMLLLSLVIIPLIIAIIASIIYVSRTRLIVTPFETEALQIIKEKQKDVIYLSQTNYHVKPIYKAVKPLLYENYQFGENLTGTNWQVVMKTEKDMEEIPNYHDKLIVVPRYLGAEFSEEEMKKYSVEKIFDNGQISIFEKQ